MDDAPQKPTPISYRLGFLGKNTTSSNRRKALAKLIRDAKKVIIIKRLLVARTCGGRAGGVVSSTHVRMM